MSGYLCLIQSAYIFLVDGQIEELCSCSNSSDIVTQGKHVVVGIRVFETTTKTLFIQFPHSLDPTPRYRKSFFRAHHMPFKVVLIYSWVLLLLGITFSLKNLSSELKSQSRKRKLINLPSSSLTAFSNEWLYVEIKVVKILIKRSLRKQIENKTNETGREVLQRECYFPTKSGKAQPQCLLAWRLKSGRASHIAAVFSVNRCLAFYACLFSLSQNVNNMRGSINKFYCVYISHIL